MDLFARHRDEEIDAAIDALRNAGIEARGAVFTRPEVVEFILDLAGYTVSASLWRKRVLEPSAGVGAFLLLIIKRLLESYALCQRCNSTLTEDLKDKVRAVEIHHDSSDKLRTAIRLLLISNGIPDEDAEVLVQAWVIEDDFLFAEIDGRFDFVFGNPPYVRQELIADALMARYRAMYKTIYDRADLYVPFIERSLSLLAPGGRLGFICADRWMKNRYGLPLRKMIAEEFALEFHVDMVGTDAFDGQVSSYPAITIIAHEKLAHTRLAHRPKVSTESLRSLTKALKSGQSNGLRVHVLKDIARSEAPWILDQFDELAMVRELESRLPLLEEAGCKVGIGVATGADKVFISKYDELPVEPSRKERLVMASDIRSGVISWSGHGVVNPFAGDGRVVNLDKFPLLERFLLSHEQLIRRRNVAQRNPNGWFRTIDRIYPELTKQPKLLIPDIKGEPNIVLDEGNFYPHHNLYYVTSTEWPLPFLQILLRSTIARLFVELYSVRMRGGYLRFQAQYLRRIRLPHWSTISPATKGILEGTDPVSAPIEEVDNVACLVYEIPEATVSDLRKTTITGEHSCQ